MEITKSTNKRWLNYVSDAGYKVNGKTDSTSSWPGNNQPIYSWFTRDVTKNQTKKLSILLSFYFHEVLQYLNTFT